MKVLQIVKTAVGANWAYQQVRVLCSLGINIVVALPSETEGLAPLYRKAGAGVVRADLDFPARRPWLLPARLQGYRELVRRVQPDLIHMHHVGTMLAVRLALGKKSTIPRVYQVAGPFHLEHKLFAELDVRTAGPQDRWIATCKWTERKYHELGIAPNRVFLSYSGIDTRRFHETRTGLLRQELKLSNGTLLVGMVCYIYAPNRALGHARGVKGHEDFFAALRLVHAARPEIRGVIIGGAWGTAEWYEKRLRRLGAEICDGFLTLLGTRSNVPALYPDLDLAVVPSNSENVGGAVEPLLSGVPVVATNVGGLPDLVVQNETGWLVSPRNPKALAQSILEALANPAEARRRAVAGRKLARTLFDVETTARQVAEIYNKIISEHRGHGNEYQCV